MTSIDRMERMRTRFKAIAKVNFVPTNSPADMFDLQGRERRRHLNILPIKREKCARPESVKDGAITWFPTRCIDDCTQWRAKAKATPLLA